MRLEGFELPDGRFRYRCPLCKDIWIRHAPIVMHLCPRSDKPSIAILTREEMSQVNEKVCEHEGKPIGEYLQLRGCGSPRTAVFSCSLFGKCVPFTKRVGKSGLVSCLTCKENPNRRTD